MEDMHIHLKSGVTEISIMKKYIEKCRELGINKVLFLDHGNRISPKHTPVLNNSKVIDKFFENINIIKKENPDIEINAGIESDFSYDEEFKEKEIKIIKNYPFDYVIGSVHGMDKADYIDYLQANLDMLETYPLDILGHLKLRKEYEKYKEIIEKIVQIATEKNVKFDINTSDRSRWNIQQLEYMLNLFKKYGTKYTIGSDAHCIDEIGYHIKEEYIKIDKIINKSKRDIEYTVVSRGTEKYGSQGYIGITKPVCDKRLLVLSKHFDKYIDTYKDSFKIPAKYTIENIAISRFELMGALALKPILNLIYDNILIIGLGNIGFTALLYLLENKYKNISIITNGVTDFHTSAINELNKEYNARIRFTSEYDSNYNTYIEATGNSKVIENIIETAGNLSNIVLLGVPREEKYLINPLDINRKNLRIIGGHELNGHSIEERDNLFKELLEINNKKNLKNFVNIYNEVEGIREKILNHKENFIEVIKYDL